jgi:hypothetical protein
MAYKVGTNEATGVGPRWLTDSFARSGAARPTGLRMRRWEMLSDPAVGGAPEDRLCVDAVLMHPDRGIALIDIAPKTTPRAVSILRNTLRSTSHMPAHFDAVPIVYCCLALEEVPSILRVLNEAFSGHPPLNHFGVARVAEVWAVLGGESRPKRSPAKLKALLALSIAVVIGGAALAVTDLRPSPKSTHAESLRRPTASLPMSYQSEGAADKVVSGFAAPEAAHQVTASSSTALPEVPVRDASATAFLNDVLSPITGAMLPSVADAPLPQQTDAPRPPSVQAAETPNGSATGVASPQAWPPRPEVALTPAPLGPAVADLTQLDMLPSSPGSDADNNTNNGEERPRSNTSPALAFSFLAPPQLPPQSAARAPVVIKRTGSEGTTVRRQSANSQCTPLLSRLQLGERPTYNDLLLLRSACTPRS